MSSIILHIKGMDCPSCASKLERALSRVDGIAQVSVSLMSETASLDYQDAGSLEKAEERIRKLGYTVVPPDNETATAPLSDIPRIQITAPQSSLRSYLGQKKIRMILVYALALSIAFILSFFHPQASRYYLWAALAFGLAPIAGTVFASWRSREFFTIETLLLIASLGALFIGEEEEATIVVLLFLIGEFLEGYAANRARSSIQSLKKLAPSNALLITDEQKTVEIDAQELKPGDMILVRPGDHIAADGIIISGDSTINEASLTGESIPKHKITGETVFASTVNLENALHVQVTQTSQNNMISRVIQLVEQAQDAKAPTQRFIDRFAYYYTPGVLLLGLLVAILPPLLWNAEWIDWIYKGLAVLLIGCPCALVISTPAAIVSSLANAARNGILIKGGEVLEKIGKITQSAFDKTGTLTEGRAIVTDVIPLDISRTEFLELASSLEAISSHPLATAIRQMAENENIVTPLAESVKVHVGKGVSGSVNQRDLFLGSVKNVQELTEISDETLIEIAKLRQEGKTVSLMVETGNEPKKILGIIALRDEPRPDAINGIRKLHDLGIKTLMVTGDSKATAEAIGKELQMDQVYAELLPEDKLAIIRQLQEKGEIVAKIGDGINDAPGLAAADIGIAMGQATDVALETADAALLSGHVGDVANLVSLSRNTLAIIHQNILMALGLKGFFLITTLAGITGLWPAILADTGATVLVTLNSLRLLQNRKQGEES